MHIRNDSFRCVKTRQTFIFFSLELVDQTVFLAEYPVFNDIAPLHLFVQRQILVMITSYIARALGSSLNINGNVIMKSHSAASSRFWQSIKRKPAWRRGGEELSRVSLEVSKFMFLLVRVAGFGYRGKFWIALN